MNRQLIEETLENRNNATNLTQQVIHYQKFYIITI
jgi:hypothetical protein